LFYQPKIIAAILKVLLLLLFQSR